MAASSLSRVSSARLHAYFSRDGSAVQFYRALMDTKIAGDLLVKPALNNVGEYFELPFG